MRAQDLAVCRVNLDKTTCVFQIGSELAEDKKWHIMVCGIKDGAPVSVFLTIDVYGYIKAETITSLSGMNV